MKKLSDRLCNELGLSDGYAEGMETWLANVHEAGAKTMCYRSHRDRHQQSRYAALSWEQVLVPVLKLARGDYGLKTSAKPGQLPRFIPMPALADRLQRVKSTGTFHEVILLRAKKWWDEAGKKHSGETIEYEDTEQTRRMRQELRRYNSFMAGVEVIDGTGHRHTTHLVRIFNDGSFDCGGRFYRASYQELSGEERRQLRIDGLATVELDYSALHPTMLFLQGGLSPAGDPYTVPGIDRDVMKLAFNVAVNAQSEGAAVGCLTEKLGSHEVAKQATEALQEHLPQLSGHLFTGAGVKLQRQDSDMAARVMARFLELSKPVLVVHDSFVVQQRDRELLHQTMVEIFQQVLGTDWTPSIK